jgi:hypothetical protein
LISADVDFQWESIETTIREINIELNEIYKICASTRRRTKVADFGKKNHPILK